MHGHTEQDMLFCERKLRECFTSMQPLAPVRASLARTRFENVTIGGPVDFSGQTYIDSNVDGIKQGNEAPYHLAQVHCLHCLVERWLNLYMMFARGVAPVGYRRLVRRRLHSAISHVLQVKNNTVQ
jgi:hypothetical protein